MTLPVADKPLLEVTDLQVHYPTPRGTVRAVDGVSFTVLPRERFGLIGESGSGKSTIALALLKLIKPPGKIVGGEAWLEGVNLLNATEEQMRALRLSQIALVTQGAMNSLNPVMRIREQMCDGLRAHGVRLGHAEENERVVQLLQSVDLAPQVANHFPHELSGGMKQRVCIAIAISLRPKLIIADEPTSALDVIVQRRVMQTLLKVQKALGASVILIGHDMGIMAQFANRLGVMRAGQLVEVGDVKSIFASPKHPYTKMLMDSLPSLEQKNLFQTHPSVVQDMEVAS